MVYHNISADEVMQQLQTVPQGLTNEEVAKRQQEYGRNTMPEQKVKTLFGIFIRQFLNPLIYVLVAAAAISAFAGDIADALFITAIIVINAILGTYQEWNAESSANALKAMVKIRCRVRRGGRIYEVNAEELVPGDIVLLESGYKVPADIRLLEVNELSVEEALLTGESLAVIKKATVVDGDDDIGLGDRLNMVFAATAVQKGRGVGVVVETGQRTEIGKIAWALKTTEDERTPLEMRMESFSRKISIVVLLVCILLGIIGYMEGMPAKEMFFMMVAVGVSAIPEGLPIALTVALSIGTKRMAAKNVIVRKLPAVEGLGSCTFIASDKTGTLTMDQQSVKKLYIPGGKYYDVTGQGYNGEGALMDGDKPANEEDRGLRRFMVAGILNNEGILRRTAEGWEHSGDAVDVAFRALAYKLGKEPAFYQSRAEVVKLISYESERKYSGVYFREDGRLQFSIKGAVEVVLKMLPAAQRESLEIIAEQMASEGFRVLAVAGGEVTSIETQPEELSSMHLLGFVGMIDPLRPEAKAAVNDCHTAGIEVVMVTGDHPVTALAISRSLGIATKETEVITGAELSAFGTLSAQELSALVKDKKVFARVAPLQKQEIVEAMKYAGHFVAVTGDGANDAPALRSAHIGIAMGAGTDLAKEASSIIVTDNDFASIAAGVEQGRITFDNLRKIIYMLLSTGAAELLTIAITIVLGMPLPFIAVQLLWLNLVTNGIQDISLAFEKGDKNVMVRPPRKANESIFDRLMISQILVSCISIAGIVFGVWQYLLANGYEQKHARTIVVMVMVLMQNFHTLNCRSELRSIFKIPVRDNYMLIGAVLLAQLVHISASYIPGLNNTLQLDPIAFNEWIVLVPVAASMIVIMEVFKYFWRRRVHNIS